MVALPLASSSGPLLFISGILWSCESDYKRDKCMWWPNIFCWGGWHTIEAANHRWATGTLKPRDIKVIYLHFNLFSRPWGVFFNIKLITQPRFVCLFFSKNYVGGWFNVIVDSNFHSPPEICLDWYFISRREIEVLLLWYVSSEGFWELRT